jgi:hypothetical protein
MQPFNSLYFHVVSIIHANLIRYYFGLFFSVRAEIRIKKGQKCFQKSKMDKKNVQFSKAPTFYEKGVKISPF